MKTVSALSNGAGTTLKTGLEKEQVQRNVTKTLLKSILKVYKSDGKFYIDHAAAYRFIGTQEDNDMWNNTYNQLRKNYAQNITNELKKVPTPITGKAVQLNKSKLLTK